MADAQKAVTLIVTLLVAALMAAFILPIGIEAIAGAESQTATLNTSESTELQPDLTATLDSVDDTADTATYTINASGETASATVDNGTSTTVTADGTDVNITVSDVTTTSATATFDSSKTYSWGGGAASLWFILPVMIVLAVFLYFVKTAVSEL